MTVARKRCHFTWSIRRIHHTCRARNHSDDASFSVDEKGIFRIVAKVPSHSSRFSQWLPKDGYVGRSSRLFAEASISRITCCCDEVGCGGKYSRPFNTKSERREKKRAEREMALNWRELGRLCYIYWRATRPYSHSYIQTHSNQRDWTRPELCKLTLKFTLRVPGRVRHIYALIKGFYSRAWPPPTVLKDSSAFSGCVAS